MEELGISSECAVKWTLNFQKPQFLEVFNNWFNGASKNGSLQECGYPQMDGCGKIVDDCYADCLKPENRIELENYCASPPADSGADSGTPCWGDIKLAYKDRLVRIDHFVFLCMWSECEGDKPTLQRYLTKYVTEGANNSISCNKMGPPEGPSEVRCKVELECISSGIYTMLLGLPIWLWIVAGVSTLAAMNICVCLVYRRQQRVSRSRYRSMD
jgi:hypothetical protein